MADWTPPKTYAALTKLTAAELNTYQRDNLLFLAATDGADNTDSRTFTNSSYADLDALSGGSGTIAAVSVSIVTGTAALVTIANTIWSNSGGITLMSYRVSGASTIASSDAYLRTPSTASVAGSTTVFEDGLTAGTNVFELQARVTAGTGSLTGPRLIVQPLP